MQDFSNLLRHRLGANPEPQTHPDADLLSAYVEQALPASEQRQIVEHLAACSACREVVALSLPALPEKAAAAWKPTSKPRFWALGFRWAAVAATFAIAATLVVEKPWQHLSRPEVRSAQVQQSAAPSIPDNVTPQQNAAAQPAADSTAFTAPSAVSASAGDMTRADVASKTEVSRVRAAKSTFASAVTTREPVVAAGLLSRNTIGAVPNNLPDANSAMKAQVSPAPPAIVAGMVPSSKPASNRAAQRDYINVSRFGAAVDDAANTAQITGQPPMIAAPEPRQAEATAASANMRRSFSPALNAEKIGSTAYSITTDPVKTASAPPPPSPSSGKQSSLIGRVFTYPMRAIEGAGKSASSNGASSSNGSGFMSDHVTFRPSAIAHPGAGSDAESLHWRVSSDGRLMNSSDFTQWHEAYPQNQDLRFKVVVSEGHEIWAGGSHLTLVHSWNGGQNWKKLDVANAAAGSTGDITDISIDDGNVQVKTSNGQTLVSHDHGVTWVPLQQNAPK